MLLALGIAPVGRVPRASANPKNSERARVITLPHRPFDGANPWKFQTLRLTLVQSRRMPLNGARRRFTGSVRMKSSRLSARAGWVGCIVRATRRCIAMSL